MTTAELSEKLWDNAERVAKFLLPKGHLEGKEWCAGNTNGDAGKSLKINIGGKKTWADFASGDSGDLLDLWVLVRNCQLHDAMREAKEFLGLKDDDRHFESKKKTFSRPTKKGVKKANHCYEYLASRGITRETIDKFRVSDAVVWYHDGNREVPAIAYPYIRNGELLQVKRIGIERPDGKKLIMAEADCEPCLFGWQALDKNTRLVVLCEGEIDCMSYAQMGFPALSVPFGGGKGAKQQWIEYEYHNLDRFDEIWLSMDNDDVGREAAKEIARRLGEHRCRLVELPHKDINECMMAGMDSDAVFECIERAKYFDPDELCSAGDLLQETIEAFEHRDTGLFTSPWPSLNRNFKFRASELTLINGVNGHGKACPLSEPILLADGTWTTHGAIKIGDRVASVDGQSSVVTGIFPQGVRDVYRVTFEDGRYVDCADEHLWEVTSRGFTKGEKRRVINTLQLKRLSETKSHKNGVRVPEITGDFGVGHEPLAWVIGALLGDGGLSNGCVKFSNIEPYMIERMKAELVNYNFSGNGKDWLISTARGKPNPLMETLRGYGLMGCTSKNKFIPQVFFSANKSTRIDLLCGLMETDGYVEKDGTVVFSSASEELRDGVVQLVNSLGGVCRKRVKTGVTYTFNGHKRPGMDSYEARIRLSSEAREAIRSPRINARLTAHRFESCGLFVRCVEIIGEADCLCIMVDHPRHLYVTRDYVATHNTEVVGHIAVDAMSQGVRVCIASLEMKPGKMLARLTRQTICTASPKREEIIMTNEWFSDRLWVFKLTGTAKAGRLLEIFAYARRRYGVELFVIDNLAKCGLDEDDYTKQKNFIDALCDFKNEHNCHVLLVTHSRKTSEATPTGKMDVKGTGALTDMPDNVMAVWRNIPRERALRKTERMGHESLDKDEQASVSMPASMIRLLKQREGEGWLGDISTNFDARSHQFLEGESKPYNYLAGQLQSELDLEWEAGNVTRG